MEGGIRLNAFVSGGFLPSSVLGTKSEGFCHIADWYATFCALAGVDATDARAAAAGLPPIDSLDVGPMIWAGAASPRTQIAIGSSDDADNAGNTIVQVGAVRARGATRRAAPRFSPSVLALALALALAPAQGVIDVPSGLKLILGQTDPAFFQGPTYPNKTSTVKPPHLVCGDPDGTGKDKGPGCLFDMRVWLCARARARVCSCADRERAR
jgi:hypothetical protein